MHQLYTCIIFTIVSSRPEQYKQQKRPLCTRRNDERNQRGPHPGEYTDHDHDRDDGDDDDDDDDDNGDDGHFLRE